MNPNLRTMLLATTPREWALLGAGPVLTAACVPLVLIVWRGGWAPARAEQQLFYLGTALLVTLAMIAVVVVALAAVRLHARGVGGTELNIDPGGDPPPPGTTVTREVRATVTKESTVPSTPQQQGSTE